MNDLPMMVDRFHKFMAIVHFIIYSQTLLALFLSLSLSLSLFISSETIDQIPLIVTMFDN